MAEVARRAAVLLVRNGVTYDSRVLRAAGVLRDLGHAVTIVGAVTADAPQRSGRVAGHQVVRVRARSPVGLLSRSVPAAAEPLARAHRAWTAADWTARALWAMRRVRPAMVHANDHNTMWAALAARRLWSAGVLYDSHELWPDRNGRTESRRWLIWAERRFVRRADAVVTASPGYARVIARRHGIAEPAVVRNVPDRRPAAPAVRREEAVYVGGLMPGRGLEVAIRALRDLPGLRLRIVGDGRGEYVRALARCAREARVADRVELAGPVPPEEVLDAIAGAAVGLCLIEPICLSYELTLPNKLFEYVAAGVPVLGSDVPEIARAIREWGIGQVADPADPSSVAAGVRRVLDSPGPEIDRRLAACAAAVTWSRERLELVRAYDAVASRRAGGRAWRSCGRESPRETPGRGR